MKVVKVLWEDSCNSNMNWTVAEDIEVEPMYIDSFGIVVKDTDEFLAIAQNYGDNPEQYSNITTIPKGCIKEVFVIHEDNVFENEQKPTDKVEPKFHKGDRIIYHGTENIYQVVAIIDNQYQLKYGNNYTVQNCADVDRCARFVGHCQRCEEPADWSEELMEAPQKVRIYISGPISGYDLEERRKAFMEIEERLKAQGYETVNPMKNGLPDEATTHEHMKRDIELLLTCDMIYFMKKWTHSKGCKVEFDVATAIGLPVMFEEAIELTEFCKMITFE